MRGEAAGLYPRMHLERLPPDPSRTGVPGLVTTAMVLESGGKYRAGIGAHVGGVWSAHGLINTNIKPTSFTYFKGSAAGHGEA